MILNLFEFRFLHRLRDLGAGGCGTEGKVVASNTKDPQFESLSQQSVPTEPIFQLHKKV